MSPEEIAVRVTHLGKCYQIYPHPRDRLKQSIVPRLSRLVGRPAPNYFHDLWVLRDVSFEVRRGDTVGIIGRNGSGKSTLLQLICGTMTPSAGRVETSGRVAALLELGAGFNPEFTGRENVYLNGSVLGLSRKEIDQRYDSISAFADIGEFIDQPVKTYSSGMYVRLAFAVIAHVDADILVIDEALAVGDAVFTQKCMRFIRRFQEHGTLLFVSHDMSSVVNLCSNAIWLHEGRIRQMGASKAVSQAYLKYTLQEVYGDSVRLEPLGAPASTITEEPTLTDRHVDAASDTKNDPDVKATVLQNLDAASGWKTGIAEILAVTLEKRDGAAEETFLGGEQVCMTITAVAHGPLSRPILGFIVRDRLGQDLFGENTLPFTEIHPSPVDAGQKFKATFRFRLPMLPNGNYSVMASVADGDAVENVQHHYLHDALIIHVSSNKRRYGLVGIPFDEIMLEQCS